MSLCDFAFRARVFWFWIYTGREKTLEKRDVSIAAYFSAGQTNGNATTSRKTCRYARYMVGTRVRTSFGNLSETPRITLDRMDVFDKTTASRWILHQHFRNINSPRMSFEQTQSVKVNRSEDDLWTMNNWMWWDTVVYLKFSNLFFSRLSPLR